MNNPVHGCVDENTVKLVTLICPTCGLKESFLNGFVVGRPRLLLSSSCWIFLRVLQEVDFVRQFKDLPEFVPEESSSTTPLPQSPRAIISNYKKKRKVSLLGGTFSTQVFCEHSEQSHLNRLM